MGPVVREKLVRSSAELRGTLVFLVIRNHLQDEFFSGKKVRLLVMADQIIQLSPCVKDKQILGKNLYLKNLESSKELAHQ